MMDECLTYIDALPVSRRQRVLSIIQAIEAAYPAVQPSLKYKMPTFELGHNWIAVGNQKRYISVYTCAAVHLVEFKRRCPHIKTGTGCINFKDTDVIDYNALAAVISSALNMQK